MEGSQKNEDKPRAKTPPTQREKRNFFFSLVLNKRKRETIPIKISEGNAIKGCVKIRAAKKKAKNRDDFMEGFL